MAGLPASARVGRDAFRYLLRRPRDRAGASRADRAEVDLPETDHLGCGAADEDLVGRVELVTGDGLLLHRVAQVGQQVEHRVPRQALQDVHVGWSQDATAL